MTTGLEKYVQANQQLWNAWTSIHEKSQLYDLDGFKSGKSSLKSIELEELGDVSGKSLLHLQCHFGLDSLSWARLGARVTGVDFSSRSIALANDLSAQLNIPANFVCCDIYQLTNVLQGKFDIVFTSYGVLRWLNDLNQWAKIISHYLQPGGTFYISEFHPFVYLLEQDKPAHTLKLTGSYLATGEPVKYEGSGSYADRNAPVSFVAYGWNHHLGEIINALVQAGLEIEFLHEFPKSVVQSLPCMEQDESGWWQLPFPQHLFPLTFSLKARLKG
jgi:2-polyprenyl-3-methyl-5-hydroxy-6-metoxy-1,4-benzoquinol methylase